MRYHEIASGFALPVSSEEQEILDRISKDNAKDTMSEREQEVARLMVSRGLLIRRKDDNNKIIFIPSSIKDIWKDR